MSCRVYYYYRNGAFEFAEERSPYGPTPIKQVLALIENINADPLQNPHWKTEVRQQLSQKKFRCTQILTTPSNESGMFKLAYLFSKIVSHPKLILSALATAILAPGYLIKNHPNLALYLGSPTLKKFAKAANEWFKKDEEKFLDLIRMELPVAIGLYAHLQRNPDIPLVISGETFDCRQMLDISLFRIVLAGIFRVESGVVISGISTLVHSLEELNLGLDTWRYFIPDYNEYILRDKLLREGKGRAFAISFITFLRNYSPHLSSEISEIEKKMQDYEFPLEILDLTRIEKIGAKIVAHVLKPEVLGHVSNVSRIIEKDASFLPKGELLKEHICQVANQSSFKVTDYFIKVTIERFIQQISKQFKKEMASPFFFKYVSFIPYVKNVESLYKEFASLAKFSWIEWRLIGSATVSFGKNLIRERNWKHLIMGVGVSVGVTFIAYRIYNRFIKPDFTKWKNLKLESLKRNPRAVAKRFPSGFLRELPQTTDYKIWYAVKLHTMQNFRTLPQQWQKDPIFQQRKCTLFSTPIRIPVKLILGDKSVLTDSNQNVLLFEEAHLEAWLNQQQSASPIQDNLPSWWTSNAQQNILNSIAEIETSASDEIELRCLLLESKIEEKKYSWERFKNVLYRTGVFF